MTNDKSETERGDAILKRMLQSKPKPHKDMVKERRKGELKPTPAATLKVERLYDFPPIEWS